MTDSAETAILAGGGAWITQQLLRHPFRRTSLGSLSILESTNER